MGTGTNRLIAIHRVVLLLAALLLAWGVAVLVTGGVVVDTRWGAISSRAAVRPFIGGALLLLLYFSRWPQHGRAGAARVARLPLPAVLAGCATVVALVVGLGWGVRIAGGPDAAGYVSQADMLVRGQLTLRAPEWAADATWANADLASAPVGYHPSDTPHMFAPTYSPGLPLLMALLQTVAGAHAVFLVVPLLAAVAVWGTHQLGNTLGGPWAGAAAAMLLVCSPAFLVMTVQAMSDVPVTAFWTLSTLAALRGRAASAGGLAGIAILVRPNVLPVAAIPAALLLLPPEGRWWRGAVFVAAASPAALIVGGLNWFHHGSPLRSGYGPLGDLYALSRVLPNAEQYARWFIQSQTALPLLGLLAPAVARASSRDRARLLLVCVGLPLVVVAMYLPYLVFQPHEWSYLRFLLPAYPALFAGIGVVLTSAIERTGWRTAAASAAALVVAALIVHEWQFAARHGVFSLQETDERYARAVAHVRGLPDDAVLVSLAHSGTLWFYTGRDVLRFDALDGSDIDKAVSALEARGHPVYLVGDPFEIEMFRTRFAGTRAVAQVAAGSPTDLQGTLVYTLTPLTARNSGTP